MSWTSIFIAGFITYFTRVGMITLINKDVFNENFRKILNYVPSVVFPSIIFPNSIRRLWNTCNIYRPQNLWSSYRDNHRISLKKCYPNDYIRTNIILVFNIHFLKNY